MPVTECTQTTANKLHLDVSNHSSKLATAVLLRGVDLIVSMELQHVIDLSAVGALLPRTFTLPELARLAGGSPDREGSEAIADWLARIAPGRTAQTVLSSRPEEIDDPIGRPLRQYRRAAHEIEQSLVTIFDAAFGPAPG